MKSPFFRPTTPALAVASRREADHEGGEHPHPPAPRPAAVREHKSTLLGCTANLMCNIVGSGIIGIPFALLKAGFGAGIFLILLTALITTKSLRLLVETAKHIHVPTYETAAEAIFGIHGFRFILANMFIIAYGAMVTYLMIVRDSVATVLDVQEPAQRQACLLAVSFCIMFPLSSLRDMADLDKTSRIAVLIDMGLAALVAYAAPWEETVRESGGWIRLFQKDTVHMDTLFVGLGVLSFAYECQESAFLVAGSLDRPTTKRWAIVTAGALSSCMALTLVLGATGYLGFLEETDGNILNNLNDSPVGPYAHAMLGVTMLCVYPLASFVARHVCVVLLFQGRAAHEGDDSSILNRRDRRLALTFALYVLALVPALFFEDMGIVLSLAGTIGGSCLAYIGPGLLYLGVHGARFQEVVDSSWLGRSSGGHRSVEATNGHSNGSDGKVATEATESTSLLPGKQTNFAKPDSLILSAIRNTVWYLLGFPLWCRLASVGDDQVRKHAQTLASKTPYPIRIGDVYYTHSPVRGSRIHRRQEVDRAESLPTDLEDERQRRSSEPTFQFSPEIETILKEQGILIEPDPQEAPPGWYDFLVAIFFICFGFVALFAGLFSLYYTNLIAARPAVIVVDKVPIAVPCSSGNCP